MPSKGRLMNGQFGAAHTSRYEEEYNSINKKPVFKQLGPRPTSGLRKNNPHPSSDFLLPKNLQKVDDEQKFQSHIQNAVRDHLMKLYQSGNVSNPQLAEIIRKTLGQRSPAPSPGPPISPSMFMRESEMMEHYVNPTEDALEQIMEDDKLLLKREQGNSYKKAGKVYRDISDEKEQLDDTNTADPLYMKINRTPRLGSDLYKRHWLQWPKAHPPTPGGKRGLNDSLVAKYHAKYTSDRKAPPGPTASNTEPATTKRLHTPPTPPEHSSRRVQSASYEAQVKSVRTQSQAGVRSKSASPLLEKDEVDDLATSNGKTNMQRPKTAGPQLAKSMIMHPRMTSWIDTATDYEKQVAYSMLRTLSGRKTTDDEFNEMDAKLNCTPAKPHPSRKTWAPANKIVIPPATHTFDAYVPPSPAPVKPVPNRNGRKDKVTGDQWLSLVDQTIQDRMTPQERDRTTIQMLPRATQRPHARHQQRPKPPKDYRHENSFFNFTKKPSTGQFTISPDWVSEHIKPRRIPKKPTNAQLRYGSMV